MNTTVKEIEQVIGLVLRMGIVQMPGIHIYFEEDTRCGPVADINGKNRLQLILRCLHFVDNDAIPDECKTNKLWKIRPFLEKFREQCLLAIPGEEQSIDEMIPFTGRFCQIKQYLRGKPSPWGFKKNYKVFADNLLTSVALMEEMQKNGFPIHWDRHGSFDYRLEQNTNTNCVRRLDTKMVTLMSIFAGVQPSDMARRWDKTAKEHKDVTRPFIIKEYNSHTGGIDQLDSCTACYKFSLKSRRWYLYVFWLFVQLAIINAWLWYRRDSDLSATAKPLNSHEIRSKGSKLAGRSKYYEETWKTITRGWRIQHLPQMKMARKNQFAHWPIKTEKCRRYALRQMKTDTNFIVFFSVGNPHKVHSSAGQFYSTCISGP
ncbi:piggyBac transposable element-derived protein 3-like [Penaeus monodon]|uniref:piggyBac transposable element-derived protein 3-like n=1 Tax=Penaeus monodon TaxID=6687 RepID=UPI0018A70355|nr:piggyBac transposable element-derived protein 3-like [Penaeus monodon]